MSKHDLECKALGTGFKPRVAALLATVTAHEAGWEERCEGKTWTPRRQAGLSSQGSPGASPLRYLVLELGLGTVLPLLKHVRQFVQAAVVEVEDLVLTLPAGDDQLAAGTSLVAERPWRGRKRDECVNTGFYFQV